MATKTTSDEDVGHFCDPCKTNGDNISPKGFCDTCKQYLCYSCFKYHRVPLQTRHHVLLDKDNMPTGEKSDHIRYVLNVCSDICAEHKDERLSFVCNDHDAVCCGACMMKYHNKCVSKHYMPDLKLETDKRFTTMTQKLTDITGKLDANIKKLNKNVSMVTVMKAEALKAAQNFRKEVDDYLDKLLIDFEDNLKALVLENNLKIESFHNKCSDLKLKLEALQSKLVELRTGSDMTRLYVSMKKSTPLVDEAEKTLSEGKAGGVVSFWNFEPEQKLKDLRTEAPVIGTVQYSRSLSL